jgi:hypothetical protein
MIDEYWTFGGLTIGSATLSTTSPTWADLSSNPGSRDGKPANNSLSSQLVNYSIIVTQMWVFMPNFLKNYLLMHIYQILCKIIWEKWQSHWFKQTCRTQSTIFWDITTCSPLWDNRRFGGTYRLYLQDRHLLSRWFLARLIFRPWKWRRYISPKRRLTLSGLHGVISKKNVLFITTAVRTSNPTCRTQFYSNSVYAFSGAGKKFFAASFYSPNVITKNELLTANKMCFQ